MHLLVVMYVSKHCLPPYTIKHVCCIQALLDNVVEFLLSSPLPNLLFLSSSSEPQPAPGIRLTLRHDFELTGVNTVRIVFESTTAKAVGPDWINSWPQLSTPEVPEFLRPPRDMRAATFDVVFLDDEMRVTRGDRGELRMFLKDEDLEPKLPVDYID